MTPTYWESAKKYLSEKDPILGEIINTYPSAESLKRVNTSFTSLVRSVIGQQVSVKAADSIWKKVLNLVGSSTPQAFIDATDDDLRVQGLSWQKIKYVKNIAEFFQQNNVTEKYWEELSYQEVYDQLISIKGVGPWTIEMFGIFYLLEPDLFPLADLGVQKAVNLHYLKLDKYDTKKILKISKKWTPYRSVATWYLWRSLDPFPVEY